MDTDKINLFGNVDVELEKVLGKKDNNTMWELIIRNQSTGKEVIHYANVLGGCLVVHQATDTEGGTRQGIFGGLEAVMVCYYKSKFVLKQTLTKYLGRKFEELEKLDAYKNL